MAKYIDAEKLKAEVKALRRRKGFLSFENTEITEAYMARGVQLTCDDIVNLIQSLQREQPEVDLEKFISDFIDKKDSENQGKWCEEDIIEAMKSSFALGLNARKEGNK